MTFAEQLDTKIAHIVNGGFLDPLDDKALIALAQGIDSQVETPHVDQFIHLCFSDGSHCVYDAIGD